MSEQPRCESQAHRQARCRRPAAWVYINGEYRRLECETHAAITRSHIREPEIVRLERLTSPLRYAAMSDPSGPAESA